MADLVQGVGVCVVFTLMLCVCTVTCSPVHDKGSSGSSAHNKTASTAHHQQLLQLQQQLAKEKRAFRAPPSFESWAQPPEINKPPPREPDRTWNPKDCRPYYQLDCEGPCFDGNVLDADGCQTCTCCKALNCDSFCEESDREINAEGCKTCKCRTVATKFQESRWYQEHKEYNDGGRSSSRHSSGLDGQYARGGYGGSGFSSSSSRSKSGGGGRRLSTGANHVICPAKKYCPRTCVWNMDRNGCEVCDCKYKSVKQKETEDKLRSKWRRPKIGSSFFGKR